MTQVLDHGYLKPIEHYGSDERIIEAARMSTNKGFLGWEPGVCPICDGEKTIAADDDSNGIVRCWGCEGKGSIAGDKQLLKFLYNKKHVTPFEMAGMVIEVQAPIFVFREWHRHRTQSYNEMSARYIPLPDLNYVPTIDRLLINSLVNKQAGAIKGSDILTEEKAGEFRLELKRKYDEQEAFYQWALKIGVPKELARIDLPVGRYSRMRANANLRNWLAFLTLRSAPDAQWEIRQFAFEVGKLIAERYPRTWHLFEMERDQRLAA
jgi:thymidylate synthase (FAD)